MSRTELQFIHFIFPDFFLVININDNLHQLAKHINALHFSLDPFRSCHRISYSRQTFVQILVSLLFILQTAHQPSAHTGNLGGIQRKILFFCHFYGNRNEFRQIRMAAQSSSTDTHSSQNLCLISDTDLPQFNPRLKHCCQIFYQVTEINTSVRSKIKQYFIIIKGVFHIDQLHLQFMCPDLLQTNLVSFLLSFFITLRFRIIFRCSHTNNILQRLNNFLLVHFLWSQNDGTIFYPPGSLHDHVISLPDLKTLRIEIIYLAHIPKPDSNNFYHSNSP